MTKRITDQQIARIRDIATIAGVVSEHTDLGPTENGNLGGTCPICRSGQPTLTIAPDRNVYRCTACDDGGDVIHFVQRLQGITFADAVMSLYERAGEPLATVSL